MKFTLALQIILLFVVSLYAQEKEINCPVIGVVPPVAAVEPGEVMKFSTLLDEKIIEEQNLKLIWTLDNGTIIRGQGTKEIFVSTKGLEGMTISATIKVEGLPKRCVNEYSDSGLVIYSFPPCHHNDDQFGDAANDEIRARLDNLFIRLQSDPNAVGYVEMFGLKKDVSRREKLMKNHINLRGYDVSRIKFVRGKKEKEARTILWHIPAGADPSICVKSLSKTRDEK